MAVGYLAGKTPGRICALSVCGAPTLRDIADTPLRLGSGTRRRRCSRIRRHGGSRYASRNRVLGSYGGAMVVIQSRAARATRKHKRLMGSSSTT